MVVLCVGVVCVRIVLFLDLTYNLPQNVVNFPQQRPLPNDYAKNHGVPNLHYIRIWDMRSVYCVVEVVLAVARIPDSGSGIVTFWYFLPEPGSRLL